ncbi:MAG: transcription-repair coupling factor [Myxococcota bacterium]
MSAASLLRRAKHLRSRGVPWAELPGDALAWVLASLDGDRSVLVVCDEPDAAERLVSGLRFFHPHPSRVEPFPADDVKPYDGFSPSSDLPAQRTRVLHRLARGEALTVVTSARALMQRIPDRASRDKGTRVLRVGDTIERDDLTAWLSDSGYLATGRVDRPGTYAARGDVLDIWSAGLNRVIRVDFFDDEIESLRAIDVKTLRVVRRLNKATLLPAREERFDEAALTRATADLTRRASALGFGVRARRRFIEDLRAGIRVAGLSDSLPALVETEAPLQPLGHLPCVVVHPGSVAASLRDAWDTAHRRWNDLEESERPLVVPSDRFVHPDEVLDTLTASHSLVELKGQDDSEGLGCRPVDGLAARGKELGPVVNKLLDLASGRKTLVMVARSARRAEMLEQLLEPHGLQLVGRTAVEDCLPGEASLMVGDLPRGFIAAEGGLAFVPAHAIFGRARASRRARHHELFDVSVGNVAELKQQEPVVHRIHGIGRFEGLHRLNLKGAEQDFVKLVYRGDDVLYLPVTAIAELSRYTASRVGGAVKLDRLGGATWEARKGKVRDQLLGLAQDLLQLAARRELATRPGLPAAGKAYHRFEASFPHQETEDQAQAILDVLDDLESDVPMDRLICGDVGFGKTEVAMRAAMRMVEAGRQVAVLCPTTVLAYQHLLTFRERFEGTAVRVGMLSRFSSTADAKATALALTNGEVDIVVGTTKLLGRTIRFKDLGLVVVDEEHRFGVSQKSRLKKMRTEVDILSMSATPIPRTLQMAVSGLRSMSVIATPPAHRLSVRTTLARFNRTRVRDAILMEHKRGGQVYLVHNRVETIEAMRDKVAEWVPEVRLDVAHGQMKSEELEDVLLRFMKRDIDVLVCTAIVESGIHLPNVNTMLVHRADLFGLAQLYQLRGRVGRSDVRGNCILMTPEETTREARKRLGVLVEHTGLGAGFNIATADLELRGGGNFLGKSQSGNIDAVGYDTWVELLGETVASVRGRGALQKLDCEVDVPVPAFLPESLLTDLSRRMSWYRRLAEAPSVEALDALIDDLEGEVGSLPQEARNLQGLLTVKRECEQLGISHCRWLKVRVELTLHEASAVSDAKIDALQRAHPKRIRWSSTDGQRVVSARFTPREAQRPFRFLRWFLARLRTD